MPKVTVSIDKNDDERAVIENQRGQMHEPGKTSYQTQAVNSALINAGKTMLIQGASHYGDLTGDYMTQTRIGEALNLGADVLMIVKGGVIGAIAVGTKYAVTAINSVIAQRQNNIRIDYMREHAGFVEARGSRYGDIS